MTLIRLLAIVVLLVAPSMAFAQQPTPRQSPMKEAVDAAYALGVQTGQQVTEMMAAKDKRISDLEAYAKACGDKPGCFTPAN